MCLAGFGTLAFVDFTFALFDTTFSSEMAQIQIGWKFDLLTSACEVIFRSFGSYENIHST